ncbi:N-6 DNA methylase [Mycoplasmatota bacterium WC30]
MDEKLRMFDKKYKSLKYIDREWYKDEIDVMSYCSKSKTRDKQGNFSEEYIRARFVWSLIQTGKYDKEKICVEFKIPKGNKAKSIKPDIVVFKTNDWVTIYEKALQSKSFVEMRKQFLVFFESKKNSKTVHDAIENQLRAAMETNTSKDRIFGVYFDDKQGILVFKKIGNSELRRYYEDREKQFDGILGWNTTLRDSLNELPTQKNFTDSNISISDLSKLKIDSLDAIDEQSFSDLMNLLKRANDSIRPSSPLRTLIIEFLTLKVFDEKRSKREGRYLQFYITDSEKRADNLAEISFRIRVENLYKDAVKEYPKVLGREKRIFTYDSNHRPSKSSDEKFFVALVSIFQRRAILKAKNESFNQIIFNNFGDEKQKADKGQFFTPIPVVKNIIRMLNPIEGEEICDPCCGICDFPAMSFRYANRNKPDYPNNANNYYGFDLESSNLKLAELNLVLNGDGGATLEQMNSLSQKMLIDGTVIREGNFNTDNYNIDTWTHKRDSDRDIKKFKIIATNPPFGKGRDLKTGKSGTWDLSEKIIRMYETFTNKFEEDKVPNSMDMGVLFLENAYKLLEPGGRMGIVLSNSIASINEWSNIRKWFLSKMRLVATFDLPANTFGETGVSTTVFIAYKPKANKLEILDKDYQVFIWDIKNIGYEVKTKNRTIQFEPQYIIDEETFDKSDNLNEDFSNMIREYKLFLNNQEEEIRTAFNNKG